jgi:hypothetical protein
MVNHAYAFRSGDSTKSLGGPATCVDGLRQGITGRFSLI